MGKDFHDNSDLTIYVFINEELKLGLGESSAQAAHAVAQMAGYAPVTVNNTVNAYAHSTNRIVVLAAQNSAHLYSVLQYCEDTLGIHAQGYIDEGYACQLTSVATQPMPKELGDTAFCEFNRYGYNSKVKRYSTIFD